MNENGGYRILEIARLEESATNPRKHFAKDALADLTKSVAEKGVLVPLLVRPGWQKLDAKQGEERYEIVAGARRFRAAKAAGLKEIPVLVRELNDEQALEVQVIENLQREDVHPLEEAAGYKQLLAKGKYDVEALAAKVGKSASYVYQRLKLAELAPAAKKAFEEEQITAGHAILIARLQPHQQKEALQYATYEYEKPSVRDLAGWIESEIFLDLHSAAFPKDRAELLPGVPACVECPKRTGFSPALFADVKKKDTCTDGACFHKKAEAFVQISLSEAKKAGKELVPLNGQYSGAGKGLARNLWQNFEAKPAKCAFAEEGLVISGHAQGRTFSICRNGKCKLHAGAGAFRSAASSDPYRAQRLKEEKKRREEIELRRRILRAIAATPAKPVAKLTDEHWKLISAWALERMWHDAEVAICQALNIEPIVTRQYNQNYKDYGGALEKALAKSSGAELARWLTLFAAGADLLVGSYEAKPEKKALLQLAKIEGVKTAPIEKQFRAELAAKGKSKAKPRKSAKATA